MSDVDLEAVAQALLGPPGVPYEPHRDYRFHHAQDAVAWLDERVCSQGAGCANAGRRRDVAEFGGGGTCGLLAALFLEETQPQIRDLGRDGLTCTAYRERTVQRRNARLDAPAHGVPSLFGDAR